MDREKATPDQLAAEIAALRRRVDELERAQAALKEDSELLELLLRHSPVHAYIKEVTPTRSCVLRASENFAEMIGIPGSRMAGMSMEELFPADFAAKMTADDWKVVSDGEVLELEEELNGRYYTTLKFPITIDSRKLLAGYTLEVTDRKRAEAELRKSHRQYQQLVDHARDGIFTVAGDGRFLFVNDGICELLGYSREELLERNILDTYPEALREDGRRRLERLNQGEGTQFERGLRRKDGSTVTVDVKVWKTEDGKLQSIVRDITERKRLEDALRRSEERYRDIVESQIDFVVRYLPGGVLTFVNRSVARFAGVEPERLLGSSFYPFLHEEDRPAVVKVIESLTPDHPYQVVEGRVVTGDGRVWWHQWTHSAHFREDGTLVEYEATGRDVTEQKRLEAEKELLESRLLHAQKMEAIGTLAGGIAHDFNNILTPVVTNAELALRAVDESNPVRENIRGLLTAALRAADLVQQILAVSRWEGATAPVPLSLGTLVEETTRFLRATLPATIEIRTRLDPACGAVRADPSQLHQVLLNLCTNAAYAMAETGGVLTVSLAPAHRRVPGFGGAWVKLSVSDTGTGMGADVVDRIFDPYFTTKPVGKGSGLGLWVVHGIVARLGGEIKVHSAPGKGSVFEVRLPQLEGEAPPLEAPAAEERRGKGQRILVVDDEAEVCRVVERVLSTLGYRVTCTSGGAEALDSFLRDPTAFDAVLTDYTMPGLTGLDVADALLAARPDLPVVLGTGYSEAVDETVVAERGLRGLVLKPYSMGKLAEILEKALAPAP